jgi:predicted DNA binding protein
MTQTRLRVNLAEGNWKTDVTNEHPETVCCLPSMTQTEQKAVEVVVLSGNDIESCLWTLKEHPGIVDSTLIHDTDERAVIQLETTNSILLSAARQSETPLAFPIKLHDGTVFVDVFSTRDKISALGEHFEANGIEFQVEYIQEDYGMCDVLTERQYEVVTAAIKYGYYETPRQCSLTELANEIGIAKSTCSGNLQRAEEAIIDYFFTGYSTTTENHRAIKVAQ